MPSRVRDAYIGPMNGTPDRTSPDGGTIRIVELPERILRPYNEVAVLLGGVSVRQVYRLVDRGQLEAVSVGRRKFIEQTEIEKYIERNRVAKKEAS